MKKTYGVDVFISDSIDIYNAKKAISKIMNIPDENFWDGDNNAIGDLLSLGVPKIWAVFWRTGNKSFPVKFDIEVIEGDDPKEKLPELRKELGGDIAIPDETTDNPYSIILFKDNGEHFQTFIDLI